MVLSCPLRVNGMASRVSTFLPFSCPGNVPESDSTDLVTWKDIWGAGHCLEHDCILLPWNRSLTRLHDVWIRPTCHSSSPTTSLHIVCSQLSRNLNRTEKNMDRWMNEWMNERSKRVREGGKKGQRGDLGQCSCHFKICDILAKVQKRTQLVHYT